jgi:hypothetical protein
MVMIDDFLSFPSSCACHVFILMMPSLCSLVVRRFLDGGLASAPHWALCVSCGAWTALALWDHLTYLPWPHPPAPRQPTTATASSTKSGGGGDVGAAAVTALVRDLLPAYRGIALFFLDYLVDPTSGRVRIISF